MKKLIITGTAFVVFLMCSCTKCKTCRQYTREYDQNYVTTKADTSFFEECDAKQLEGYESDAQKKYTLGQKTIVVDTYCE